MVNFSGCVAGNLSQTKKIGKILAQKILKSKLKKAAFVLALEGELGAGKTTFAQGFAKELGVKERVLSPTFVIMKKFQVPSLKFKFFYHIDCYRIKESREILGLGFRKIISNPRNIVAIEWADRIKKILPRGVIVLKFKFIDKLKRKIVLESDNA